MRHFFRLLCLGIILLFVNACYDDDPLKQEIADLQTRINKLESLCGQMNTNISSLQTIVNALQDKDYINSISPIDENGTIIGYTLFFSKSGAVTIYHGRDGSTPQIGVRQDSNDIWYWTLNGDWLTDDTGNRIRAVGLDGANGDIPQLKIIDQYWWVSYDKGENWSRLDKAVGEDVDSFFQSVNLDDPNYVVLTFADGMSFTIPTRESSFFGSYIRNVPIGKNYINTKDLLVGYHINNGAVVPYSNGIMSNKIYPEDGQTFTLQGIPIYSTTKKICIALFDAQDKLVDVERITPKSVTSGLGTGTWTFHSFNGEVVYIRICLRASTSVPFIPSLAQMELGEIATEVEEYIGKDILSIETGSGNPRKIRILAIGNSFMQDALTYVPFILPNIADIELEMGILYEPSQTLAGHWNNVQNNTAAYILYLYRGRGCWENLGKKSIQQTIDSREWDTIILSQTGTRGADYSTYQPYLNNLIRDLYTILPYPVKFVWYSAQNGPKYGGRSFTEEEIMALYQGNIAATKRVLAETLCEAVIPVGTAVQNARNTSLRDVGEYGLLCSPDGAHLQEGLPCQLAAYVVCLTILELCGFSNKSIYGDTTRATAEWIADKNIPGRNGKSVGITDENCRLAQICAIMAHKYPFQITDVNGL